MPFVDLACNIRQLEFFLCFFKCFFRLDSRDWILNESGIVIMSLLIVTYLFILFTWLIVWIVWVQCDPFHLNVPGYTTPYSPLTCVHNWTNKMHCNIDCFAVSFQCMHSELLIITISNSNPFGMCQWNPFGMWDDVYGF